jgi:hypothetical protein
VKRASVVWRWLGSVGAIVVGAAIGLTGAFVQSQRVMLEAPWGAVTIPWGVPVVWIALVAAVRGGAWAVGSRWGAWAVMGGWLATTILLSAESPSGDVAVSGGGRQLVYLLGGVVLASAAASLPLPRTDATEKTGPDTEPTT